MAFTLPTDLATNLVDNSSTVDAAYFNGVSGMGNAVKAALGTIGYGTKNAMVTASETTTSASYADLTTTTDQVTVAVGSSGMAIVSFGAQMTNSGANYCYIGVDISGATTTAASDTTAIQAAVHSGGVLKNYSNTLLLTGLTAGVTTFKLKYKVNTGTGTFVNRRITAIPLPSTDGTHASATLPIDISSSLSLSMGGAGMNRPTYDSVGAGYKAGGDTGSWSHTIGATATALLVTVFCTNSTAAAVTVDGSAMTKLATQLTVTTGGTQYIYTFGMINPPTGTKTIAVTGAAGYLIGNSVAYTNVAGFGAVQTTTGSGTSVTQTVKPTTPGRIFYQAFGTFGNATLTSYSGNERWGGYTAGSAYPLTVGDVGVSSMGAITVTATNGNTNGFGGVAVELMPSVPTYSKPTWVGTGLGESLAHHKTNPGTSWVETVPADANLALLWVSDMPSDQANNCTATLGGTSMVEVTGSPWTFEIASGYYMRTRCFALQNPTTGPGKTVAITNNVSNSFHAATVYYGGVTAIGPAGAYARGAGGTTPTLAIPDTASNHLYALGFGYRGQDNSSTFTAFSAGASMRAVHNNDGGGYTVPIGVGDAYGNDGTLTVTATRYNSTYGWNAIAIDLRPDALPTPSTPTWVGTGAGRQHFTGNYSWTETVPANATCAIVTLGVMGNTACSVTLGGTSMTALTGSPFTLYSGNYSTQTFYLLNPGSGSKTLAVTNSNGNNVHAIVTFYGGVNGVFNQTAVTNGAGGQQPSISISNTLSSHRYLNAFGFRSAAGGDAITAVDQGTLRMSHPNVSYDLPVSVADAPGNGGTLTINGTRNSTTEWGGMAVDLSPDSRPSAALNLSLTPSISMSGTGHNGS